ncbi:MAG: hypothetical protein C5B50_21165 [Verrucomicrobia bacterium]|nr:MAG: hypothetical protein C5B50_21165 [Verrucomicrobiota bacterium]
MPFTIPQILLEGDEPPEQPGAGPGQKYDLGQKAEGPGLQSPATPVQPASEPVDLPEAYGTKELWAVARDPHTLYAHWDLTGEQMSQFKALSGGGALVLRVHPDTSTAQPVNEINLQGDSRHLFLHVERAGATYALQLGYAQPDGQWVNIATSPPVTTPPETMAEDRSVSWATLGGAPARMPEPKEQQSQSPRPATERDLSHEIPLPPPAPAWVPDADFATRIIAILPDDVRQELGQTPMLPPAADWTPEQESRLAGLIGLSLMRRSWPPSAEMFAMFGLPTVPELSSLGLSSPSGAEWAPKGFWFGVDAELVVYGATDPSATVSIAGQPVPLRPDGTFTCRFAFPEGQHELQAVAVSKEGEMRAITLKVTRQTSGEPSRVLEVQDALQTDQVFHGAEKPREPAG